MKIAKRITKWLIKKGAISRNDEELYVFALCNTFLTLVPLLSVLAVAYLMNSILEGISLVIPFLIIRKFSGGFHFNSAVICITVSIFLLISLLFFSIKIALLPVFDAGILLSGLSLSRNSPIDSEARMLDEEEKKHFKKATHIISIIFVTLYLSLRILSILYTMPIIIRIARSLSTGMIFAALLQIPVLIKNHKNDSNNMPKGSN